MTQEPGQPTMSFATAISTVFRRYAEFGGWATRPEFWWFILFAALVSTALGALNPPGGVSAIGSSLASVWAIATIVPTLAVTVRRLRDSDRRWTEMFWLLLPIAGPIVLVVHLCEPSKFDGASV
jgi:uncharacterized membrane protein YhaH (DUF805 family)